MSALLQRAESVASRLLPALFQEMNRTGHAGHCLFVSRVLNLVFEELGVRSEPLCVDYEFANAAAVQQMAEGRDLQAPAIVAKTGSGGYDGFDHHVVTLIRDNSMALLLDPTIIQIEKHLPDVSLPPIIMITLPWPRETPLPIEVGGGRLTYFFSSDYKSFRDNDQWTDVDEAKARANEVLRSMED